MNSTNNDIGKAFKEAFDGFEIKPSTDLWASVNERNIEVGNVNKYTVLTKVAASVTIIAMIFAAAFFALNKNDQIENITIVVNKIDTIKKVQRPIVNNTKQIIIDTNINEKQIVRKKKIGTVKPANIKPHKLENESDIIANTSYKKEAIVEPNKDSMTDKSVSNIAIVGKTQQDSESVTADMTSKKNDELIVDKSESNLIESDTFHIRFGDDKVICFGEDAILEVEDGYFYRWNTGDIMNKVKVSPTEDSQYSVTVSNSKGNSTTHTYRVSIDRSCSALFIPSAFTPNADGQNDVFKAEGNGILKMRMFVFDKNGNKVFETTNIDDSWDGTYKGRLLESGMFFYQAEYWDAMGYSHVKKGQVTLIK